MKHKNKVYAAGLLAAASLTATAAASRAAVVAETGDAGQTLPTALATVSGTVVAGTPVTSITGTIGSGTDVDLYAFAITNTTTFSATTVGGSTLDTELFLFNASGAAVAVNDDDAGGQSLESTLGAGSSLYATLAPGTYFLGVSLSGDEAVNTATQLLFAGNGGDTTATRGAAALVNPTTLGNFNGLTSFAETGAYAVALTSAAAAANPFAVPEPSTWAAILFGSIASGFAFLRSPRKTA